MNYTYSVASDTLNGSVGDSLEKQIRDSNITISLSSIVVAGDELKIIFKAAISASEETTLDGIISAHDGSDEKEEIVTKYEEKLAQGGKKVTYRGFQFDCAANQETEHDFVFLESLYLKDGDLEVKDSDYQDYAYMALVDISYVYAGILYPAKYNGTIDWSVAQPNGVVLHEYIKEYPIDSRSNPSVTVIPNPAITDLNVKDLAMRVKYYNHTNAVVRCKVRMRGYS